MERRARWRWLAWLPPFVLLHAAIGAAVGVALAAIGAELTAKPVYHVPWEHGAIGGAALGVLLAPALAFHATARSAWRPTWRALVAMLSMFVVGCLLTTSRGHDAAREVGATGAARGAWLAHYMRAGAGAGAVGALLAGWLVHGLMRFVGRRGRATEGDAATARRLVSTLADVDEPARAALDAALAMPLAYGLRVLEGPDGRRLFVLGEVHLKGPRAAAAGRAVVEAFPLRGLEGFASARLFAGVWLGVLLSALYRVPRLATLGYVKPSTIVAAAHAHGVAFPLERAAHTTPLLHTASVYLSILFTVLLLGPAMVVLSTMRVAWPALGEPFAALRPVLLPVLAMFELHLFVGGPLLWRFRRRRWALWAQPALAILVERDRTMALGALAGLAEHPEPRDVLLIVGRAHLPGLARELAGHGFRELAPPE